MRALIVMALCLAITACATAPSGRYVAVTTQEVAKKELPQVMTSSSIEPHTIKVSIVLRGIRSRLGRISVEWSAESMNILSAGEVVLLEYTRDQIALGGNFLGQAVRFRRISDAEFALGSIVFRKQPESNEPARHNAELRSMKIHRKGAFAFPGGGLVFMV